MSERIHCASDPKDSMEVYLQGDRVYLTIVHPVSDPEKPDEMCDIALSAKTVKQLLNQLEVALEKLQ